MKFKFIIFFTTLLIFLTVDIIISANYSGKCKSETAAIKFQDEKITNDLSEFNDMKIIDKAFDNFMKKWNIVGAAVAVLKNDKLVYSRGFGYADKENKICVQPYHRFRIASASKLITAVAIMKLVEEKKISLNDKVFGKNGILNDKMFLNYVDKRVEDITVEHLLRHQGGWNRKYGDHMFMTAEIAAKYKVKAPAGIDYIIQFALAKKLHFEPGSISAYSNLGYCILGRVIQKKTGMPYDDYVKNVLLKPLGIYSMQLAGITRADKAENEVTYYEQEDADKVPSCFGTGELVERCYGGTDYKTIGPAGGWITSITDMARLVAAIDGFPGVKDIFSNETIAKMAYAAPSISPIGWRKTSKDGTWWRTGTLAGTSVLIKRESDGITYFVFTNTGTWKGPKFYPQIEKTMSKILSSIKKWPSQDLISSCKKTQCQIRKCQE